MKLFQVDTIKAAKKLYSRSFEEYPIERAITISTETFEDTQDSTDVSLTTTSVEPSLEIPSRSSSPELTDSLASSPSSVSSQRPPPPSSPIARMLSRMGIIRSRASSESSGSLTSQVSSVPSPRTPPLVGLEGEIFRDLSRSSIQGERLSEFYSTDEYPSGLRLKCEAYFQDLFSRSQGEYPYIQGMISGSLVEKAFSENDGLYANPIIYEGEELSEGNKRKGFDQYLLQKISMVYQTDDGNWMGFSLACNIYTGEWYATVSDFSQDPAKLTIIGSGAYYNNLKTNFLSVTGEEPQELGDILKNESLAINLSRFERNLLSQGRILSTPKAPDALMKNCFLPFVRNIKGKDFAIEDGTNYKNRKKLNKSIINELLENFNASSAHHFTPRG